MYIYCEKYIVKTVGYDLELINFEGIRWTSASKHKSVSIQQHCNLVIVCTLLTGLDHKLAEQ